MIARGFETLVGICAGCVSVSEDCGFQIRSNHSSRSLCWEVRPLKPMALAVAFHHLLLVVVHVRVVWASARF